MKLAVEKLADIVAKDWMRVAKLLADHWQEIVPDKELMKLDVNTEKYFEADAAERLHIVVMRDDNGIIIGYSVHFLTDHPHYKRLRCAEDDVHYLVPEERQTGAHKLMRAFALKTLKERGVKFVTARVKIATDHHRVLRQLGYVPIDTVYGLDLTNWAEE